MTVGHCRRARHQLAGVFALFGLLAVDRDAAQYVAALQRRRRYLSVNAGRVGRIVFALRRAVIRIGLVDDRDRQVCLIDRQRRCRRRSLAVVRVRTLYVDRVLARVDLRQTAQILDIRPVLFEAVGVARRSGRCSAARGVLVVVLTCVVHILVIRQADRELLAALLNRQLAVHHSDVVVRRDVRLAARDLYGGLFRDRAGVFAGFNAAGTEGHVVRMSAYQADAVRSLRHFYRVDRDRAARVGLRLALAGEGHRPLRHFQRAVIGGVIVVRVGGFDLVGHGADVGDARHGVSPGLTAVYAVLDRGAFGHAGRGAAIMGLPVIYVAIVHGSDRHGRLRDRQGAGDEIGSEVVFCGVCTVMRDRVGCSEGASVGAAAHILALGGGVGNGQNVAFGQAFHRVVISGNGLAVAGDGGDEGTAFLLGAVIRLLNVLHRDLQLAAGHRQDAEGICNGIVGSLGGILIICCRPGHLIKVFRIADFSLAASGLKIVGLASQYAFDGHRFLC